MVPLPYTDSRAQFAFTVVLALFALLELRVRLRSRRNRRGSSSDRGSLLVVYVSTTAGLLGGFALAVGWQGAAIRSARWPLFVLGLVSMIAGVVVRQWAVAVLGRFFTVDVRVHPGQPVVVDGPYRWVAHPAYTGMIVTCVGIGLALGNGAGLAVLASVPTAGLVFRIRVEERALTQALGAPYARFVAGRAHLLPGVW